MLTERQHELLVFIDRSIKDRGFAPTYPEIQKGLGMCSRGAAHDLMTTLVEKGFVRRTAHMRSGIEVIKMPGDAPANIGNALSSAVSQVLRHQLDAEETNDLIGAIRARGFDVVERAA